MAGTDDADIICVRLWKCLQRAEWLGFCAAASADLLVAYQLRVNDVVAATKGIAGGADKRNGSTRYRRMPVQTTGKSVNVFNARLTLSVICDVTAAFHNVWRRRCRCCCCCTAVLLKPTARSNGTCVRSNAGISTISWSRFWSALKIKSRSARIIDMASRSECPRTGRNRERRGVFFVLVVFVVLGKSVKFGVNKSRLCTRTFTTTTELSKSGGR